MNKWKQNECKYHHFATPNEFMSLMVNNIEAKNNNQTSCAPWWESMTPLSIILLKALNLRLIKTGSSGPFSRNTEERGTGWSAPWMCNVKNPGNGKP